MRLIVSRRTRIYHDISFKKTTTIFVFILRKNDDEQLINFDQFDILFELTNTMNTNTNFQRATMIILCKSMYDSKMKIQIFKRAHRQNNFQKIWYYQFTSQTKIKQLIETKKIAKIDFTIETFEFTTNEMLKQKIEIANRVSMNEIVDVIDETTIVEIIDVNDMNVKKNEIWKTI